MPGVGPDWHGNPEHIDEVKPFARPLAAAVAAPSAMMLQAENEGPSWDVVIVGGGPAGLSAALVLGRCRRRVLLCDSGRPRNYVSHELHGFFTRDCSEPAELRRIGREQLQRYGTVEVREVLVKNAAPHGQGFEIQTEDGERMRCRKLLLASGVRDELPNVEGFEELYGKTAFHCPYCDGWEWRDRAVAVYGRAEKGKALALELLGWSRDVVLFSDGEEILSEDAQEELTRNGIKYFGTPVRRFEGASEQLRGVRLADGRLVEREVLFFSTPTNQGCAMASGLGCEFDEKGAVRTGGYEETNVPGLYVAGDASRHAGLAIVAAAEGARAAFAINTELLREDRI
jgi:thioredoxin reductase